MFFRSRRRDLATCEQITYGKDKRDNKEGKMNKKLCYGLIFLGLFFLSLYVFHSVYQPKELPELNGKGVPEFSLSCLSRSEEFNQEDLKGHPSLLTFFASWCFSCRIEHKMLGMISQKYNIPLYGIAYRDHESNLKDWLFKFGNPFKMIGLDIFGQVGSDFDIMGVPVTFLIDENGIIQHQVQGALISDESISDLEKAIKSL